MPTFSSAEQIKVICTTTTMKYFVEEVGGARVDAISLVQPGICPDHFDVRPSVVSEINDSSLVVYHGVEPWLDSMINASENKDVKKLLLNGPWGTPPLAKAKINSIRDALIEIDPKNKTYYEKNAADVSKELDALNEEILAEAKELGTSEYKAIVMAWQKPFSEWIGLEVIEIYQPPETLSVQTVQNLVVKGKNEKVSFVIDNLQSGTTLGAQMADEIGGRHIVFSNFPEAIPGTDTIAEMIRYNADELFSTIKEAQSESKEIAQLKSDMSSISNQLVIFQGLSAILLIITIALGAMLYKRKN
ncbi:MAG: Periplasmic solute binding protein family protein [Candidatus Methanofastidiosum methylothiophilum]|uniref:Periplasmic solute binding protein family protein n=1 Tax=Candidatus Methanofastidiosum methylothiophilum TaxID=1705564 RepID=A0A150INW3_9EURY|nr:MAG: Periplasmic solute binding protein family protein [Candidatus Methanofastidiosum methylthiophilus]